MYDIPAHRLCCEKIIHIYVPVIKKRFNAYLIWVSFGIKISINFNDYFCKKNLINHFLTDQIHNPVDPAITGLLKINQNPKQFFLVQITLHIHILCKFLLRLYGRLCPKNYLFSLFLLENLLPGKASILIFFFQISK